jgi:uncharacterized DUF497 family protein
LAGMTTRFTWDPAKATSNFRKHGVSFEEALTVFGDRWRGFTTARIIPSRRAERLLWATRPGVASSWSPSQSAVGSSASSALDVRRDMSVKTMKKRRGSRTRQAQGDLAREYQFDYTKSRSNRFARQMAKNAVVVVLDPDVAAVFRDPKRVNSLLRATIAALKKPGSRRAG